MKRTELDRLRTLLRENDLATGVDGPTLEQSERLRRTVLAAMPAPAAGAIRLGLRRVLDAPRWALAAVVVVILLAAGGAQLVRVADGARAEVESARRPVQVAVPSAPATIQPPAPTRAPAPSSLGAPEPQVAALAPRERGRQLSTGAPRPTLVAAAPAAEDPRPAAPSAATAGEAAAATEANPPSGAATPSEDFAIAALPSPLGRQIQVTAPGGTRIVWILTPSTGP